MKRRGGSVTRRALLQGGLAAAAVSVMPSVARAGSEGRIPEMLLAQQAPGRPASPIVLKQMSWWWNEAGRNEAWRTIVKKFHDSQSDVRIQEVGFPFADYFSRVMTQLAGGRLDADLITYWDELGFRLLKANQFEPIDDVAQRLGIRDKLNRNVQKLVIVNGRLYGLDCVTVPFSVLYNVELYEKGGIKKPATSQEEYLDYAKRLTSRPNQFGHASRHLMSESSGFWLELAPWVLGYGGVWAKGKKPLVTEPPAINAVKAYKRLYDEAMPQGTNNPTYLRMMAEGKVAQLLSNTAMVNPLKTYNPQIVSKLQSAPPPWPNKQSLANPHPISILASSPHKDAAKVWLEFVFRKDNIGELMERSLDVYPVYAGAARPEYINSLPWVKGFLEVDGTYPSALVEGYETHIAEFRQILLSKVSEVLTTNKPAEQAMGEAQKQLEDLGARI